MMRFINNLMDLNKVVLTLVLISQVCLTIAQTGSAPVAVGSCTDVVEVTYIPAYVHNAVYIANCYTCDPQNGCCAQSFAGFMFPSYTLQRYNHETKSWVSVTGSQETNKFTGLSEYGLGTYRVRVAIPAYYPAPSCPGGVRKVYNLFGQHYGYVGTWEFLYSNIVIVGQPTGQDNHFSFVDGNGILLFGSDPSLPIFDAQEDWKIDVSASKNYNAWWLAMYKKDPPNNLPWAVYQGGWQQDGPPANPVIDIAQWWKFDNVYPFDPGATYVVQWVATNKDCPNWNVNEKEAYICPSGFNCRFGITTNAGEEEVILYPNPVTTSFTLSGSQSVARLELLDSYGRQQATWAAGTGSYDLPPYIPSGTYYLRLFDGQNAMLKTIGVQVAR